MQYYFTITAGRTGTAWLADLLAVNLQVAAIHEPLGIDDFGTRMPDIRTMRNFNSRGNNEFVQEFWKRKLEDISEPVYVETNHALAKCGLVENLARRSLATQSTLVCLQRNITAQCASYVARNDFRNITQIWQWYLDPSYPLKLVNPEPFKGIKGLGAPLWYCYEMLARQEYYRQRYAGEMRMVFVSLEDVTTPQGAQKFLSDMGGYKLRELPPRRNESKTVMPPELLNAIRSVIASVQLDIPGLVAQSIRKGFTFDPGH